MAFFILRRPLLMVLVVVALTVLDVAADSGSTLNLPENLENLDDYKQWCRLNCTSAQVSSTNDSLVASCTRYMNNMKKNFPSLDLNDVHSPVFCNTTETTSTTTSTTIAPTPAVTSSAPGPVVTLPTTPTDEASPTSSTIGASPTSSTIGASPTTPTIGTSTTPPTSGTTPKTDNPSTEKPKESDSSSMVLFWVLFAVAVLIIISILAGVLIHRYSKKTGITAYHRSTKTNVQAAKGNVESP